MSRHRLRGPRARAELGLESGLSWVLFPRPTDREDVLLPASDLQRGDTLGPGKLGISRDRSLSPQPRQPCPGITAFRTELITPCDIGPTSPCGDILSNHQPDSLCSCRGWGQLGPPLNPQALQAASTADTARRHWVAQPPAMCGLVSQLWFHTAPPAFCLLRPPVVGRAPGSAGKRMRREGGTFRDPGGPAAPGLWGPEGLKKARGHLKRDQGGWCEMPG